MIVCKALSSLAIRKHARIAGNIWMLKQALIYKLSNSYQLAIR